MAWVVAGTLAAGVAIAGGVSGYLQSEAEKEAARTQAQGAKDAAGIASSANANALALQKEQFGKIQEILSPYVTGGQNAFSQQQTLAGLGGADAQREAINALSSSPEYQALVQQGESALLQNASATGGVRGGNTQGALAQYRPQMLTQLIEQQYNRLGGLSSMGLNASSQVAQGAGNMGAMGSQLLQQGGEQQANYAQQLAAAQAQGQLAQGNQFASTVYNPILSGLGAGSGYINAFNPPKVG